MLIYSLSGASGVRVGKALSNSEAKPSPETTLPTEPNNHILALCRSLFRLKPVRIQP